MESVDGNQEIVNFSRDQGEQARRVGGRSLIATWVESKAITMPLLTSLEFSRYNNGMEHTEEYPPMPTLT